MNQLNVTTSDLRLLQTLIGARVSQLRQLMDEQDASTPSPSPLEEQIRRSNAAYLSDLIRLYATLDGVNPI